MSEPDEIHERVTRLEAEVAWARQDAAAARVLAGGADRDVSAMQGALRAHTRLLNALRETQLEHGAAVGELRGDVSDLQGDMSDLRGEMRDLRGEMREGFAKLAVGQAQITALLSVHPGDSGEAATD